MAKDMSKTCMGGMCSKCHGSMKLVAGLLIWANAYFTYADPWAFLGGLMVVGGLLKLAKPGCPHCM